MARVLTNVTVCITCALIIANDDDSSLCRGVCGYGPHDPECAAVKHRDRMARQMATIPGHWVIGTTGDHISAEPCDACGDTDRGERMHGSVLTDDPAPAEGPTYDRHGHVDPFVTDPDRTTRREAFL